MELSELLSADELYQWARDLFPINRSLTGQGVRDTLAYLNEQVDGCLNLHSVPSGSNIFDWQVPQEWEVSEAWIANEQGEKVIDFRVNNLHLVGYSIAVDKWLTLQELQPHLYSLPEQPDAIPYITSYYSKRWGFCLTENQRKLLVEGKYRVYIDSTHKDGVLNYADCVIEGESDEEIIFTSYVCHPSMANNELSGPIVLIALLKWLKAQKQLKYTYRFYLGVETIGALVYLERHLMAIKEKVKAGFVLTCIGDDAGFSCVNSRYGDSLADRAIKSIYTHHYNDTKHYSFLQRGSDERQFCAPGIDLPFVSLCRSKFGQYPEYHTSLDNLSFISGDNLLGSVEMLSSLVTLLEYNKRYRIRCLGEPQLGKRGLYPTVSSKSSGATVRNMMNFIAYCDGKNDLIDIAEIIQQSPLSLVPFIDKLIASELLEIVD